MSTAIRIVVDRSGRSKPALLLRFLAWVFALSQAAALTIAGCLAFAGGEPTILHDTSGGHDVAAWSSVVAGRAGAALVAAEVLSILAALRLTRCRERSPRGVGVLALLAWGVFWTASVARVYLIVGDGLYLAMAVSAAIGLLATLSLWSRPIGRSAPEVGSAAAA